MIKFEDECVGCDLPCLGNVCNYKHVPHLYCDDCGSDVDILYTDNNSQLCVDCYLAIADKITIEDVDSEDDFT